MQDTYQVVVTDDYRISRTFFEMMVQSDARYTLAASFPARRTLSRIACVIPLIC